MMITIREENISDMDAVRSVQQLGFDRDEEAELVDLIRCNGGVELSLVAVLDDVLVGHILYTPVFIGQVYGAALGPMAVLPAYQRRGIGSRLIETGNRKLQERNCPFIVVLGHPEYYPRFGFRPAHERGIRCRWKAPDNAFLVLILDSQRMEGVSGLANYRSEFTSGI